MAFDKFSALLEEYGTIANIQLRPDQNNCCCIHLADGMEVYMQPETTDEQLYIVIEIGVPQKGRYREALFKEALKANGLSCVKIGIFCYSQTKDSLLIYNCIPFLELNGQRLQEIILMMLEQAKSWKEAIEQGQIPSYRSNEVTYRSTTTSSGMFGLK